MSEGAIERTCFASLKISAFFLKELLGPTRSVSAFDAVDGSSIGIAMGHIAVSVEQPPMSTYRHQAEMSGVERCAPFTVR